MVFRRGLPPMALLAWILTVSPGLTAPAHEKSIVALPTLFSPIARSMQQLIGDGYQVVNIAVGLSSFGYLLKRNDKYVTCAVQPDPDHAESFRSECRTMN